jgi:hypothetical protein
VTVVTPVLEQLSVEKVARLGTKTKTSPRIALITLIYTDQKSSIGLFRFVNPFIRVHPW